MTKSLDEFCNEPAFPESVSIAGWVYKNDNSDWQERSSYNRGLSRLEYFTAQAMSKPDPLLTAKAICLELWNVRNKGFAASTEIIS